VGAIIIFSHIMNYQSHLPSENGLNHKNPNFEFICVCVWVNLRFSNLDHSRMLDWYQNVPLTFLGLVHVLVCAGVQVLVENI
jgi:hypothetical protein